MSKYEGLQESGSQSLKILVTVDIFCHSWSNLRQYQVLIEEISLCLQTDRLFIMDQRDSNASKKCYPQTHGRIDIPEQSLLDVNILEKLIW